MASSIIFLLVIAIWAVFLLPDLQTRRHHLAQSRAANRLLGRSRILKRDSIFRSHDDGPTEAHALESEPYPALPPTAVPSKKQRRPKRRGRALAWVLATLLLLGLVAVPTTVVLSVLHILAWWSVAVAGGVLLLAVIGLRVRAMLRSKARGATRNVVARLAEVGSKSDAVVVAAPVEPAPTRPLPMVTRTAAFDQDAATPQERQLVEEVACAVAEPVHGPTAPPTNPRPVVDDRPGRWTPPSVPRPRYLMKPRSPEGPLVAPNIGLVNETAADPFQDLLTGADDLDLPESRAV